MNRAFEINFDGLVGPTHNYSGLSYGNVASMQFEKAISNPKNAALQGLAKMKILLSLGLKQGILPPQERPFVPILRSLGFYGTDAEALQKAWNTDPSLLLACSSASAMWTANAATVSPSADSYDRRVHFTPANLINKFHRSFESSTTGPLLHQIFNHQAYFAHHYPLPLHSDFSDEGAANHTRFCRSFGEPGVQLFVYGRPTTDTSLPKNFPARQTEKASQAIVRLHRLAPEGVVFAQQNPEAIDAGVFHNDVISVGHQNIFLYHEKTFVNTENVIAQLKQKIESRCQVPFIPIQVKESEIALAEAVKTYLFNSQLVTLPDQSVVLIAPEECQRSESVRAFLQRIAEDQQYPINQIIFQDIRESMQNGGGPACLRLRVVLNKIELEAMHPHVLLTEELYQILVRWVEKHYRDRLVPTDLADPQLLKEGQEALDELTQILHLGSIYPFQRIAMHSQPPPLPEKRS